MQFERGVVVVEVRYAYIQKNVMILMKRACDTLNDCNK